MGGGRTGANAHMTDGLESSVHTNEVKGVNRHQVTDF